MEGPSFMDCSECDQPIYMEELPECTAMSNDVVSVEWRSLPHHGNQVCLMGFVTVVRSSCSKQKGSSRK